jgi:succinyl-CoA synthetase alpha subunit
MIDIPKIRSTDSSIIALGSHPKIFQSILDYDFLCGKKQPSLKAIIHSGRRFEKYFFGSEELMIPIYESINDMPDKVGKGVTFFLNVNSARRAVTGSQAALKEISSLIGGAVFAENIPEKHSLELYSAVKETGKFVLGPASIGLFVPGVLKLGAIGGVDYRQFVASQLFRSGNVAVMSASGGMTNEIIRVVSDGGKGLSFALSFGGDRFPATTPEDAFLAAEKDSQTKAIVYFGELGGEDEYLLADLLKKKKITKQVICHIAGTVSEVTETPMQFGHAKALAGRKSETARAKRDALREAGAQVSESFSEFVAMVQGIEGKISDFVKREELELRIAQLQKRKPSLFTSSISRDVGDEVEILGADQMSMAKRQSFAQIAVSMFLGKPVQSKEFIELVDFIFRSLVDNGPYVSGAVNTMVTARAGKDLVSSLVSGLLTIGPRFGGAVNQAAANWLSGVASGKSAFDFVEEFAVQKKYIQGIGHKKYRADLPDPRVTELMKFSKSLRKRQYLEFALSVEAITTAKKGTLILNVDGLMAALLLDFLFEKEGYSQHDLESLVEVEFFNAFFVLPRSVGLMAHFFDQKRLDEGLFRLNPENVGFVDLS